MNKLNSPLVSRYALIALLALAIAGCEQDVKPEEKNSTEAAEIFIGSEPTSDPQKPKGSSLIITEDVLRLARVSLWFTRDGNQPVGSFRLRLVHDSDNDKLIQSASVDMASLVQSINSSDPYPGTKVTWIINKGIGVDALPGHKYRVEVIPSYSSLLPIGIDPLNPGNGLTISGCTSDNFPGLGSVFRERNVYDTMVRYDNMEFYMDVQGYTENGDLYQVHRYVADGSCHFSLGTLNSTTTEHPDGDILGLEFIAN